MHARPQQQLLFFFLDAFSDFFEPVLSFLSFFSFLFEAFALSGAIPADSVAPGVGCLMGEACCCCCCCCCCCSGVGCPGMGCWTSAGCPASTSPGAGCPLLSCAISSGVS